MAMDNQENLKSLLLSLDRFEDEFIRSAERILNAGGGKMYTLDLLSTAVSNRALQLSRGFSSLAKDENYISAIPLIRLQLDNALRFFAFTLVPDYNDLFSYYLEGKPINKYKDAKKQQLSDNYLATALDKHFPGTLNLYRETSGYIHLSERHFLAATGIKDKQKRSIQTVVGPRSNNFSEDDKIGFISTMIEVSKLVIIVLEQWKHRKASYIH
jgi:hypothetical protein